MHGEYRHIFQLAKPYLNIRRNDIHTEIVYRFAVRLLESEPGDASVALPAAICHDVGWSQVPEELHLKAFGPAADPALTRLHEIEGVKLAEEILLAVEYEPHKTAAILAIIDGHDTRRTALSASDKIVKDADKLFRFDQIGMGIDADRFQINRIRHADWLEQQIEPWFFTETGKQLAREELARFREQGAGEDNYAI
jgi:HD superfamily phosphodiesterase